MSSPPPDFPAPAAGVIDLFAPKFALHARFDDVVVTEGAKLTPTQCQHVPTLEAFTGEPGSLYTVILSDPDAPSVEDPKFGEWQHWIVVNAPADDVGAGEAVTAYFGSAPGKDSGAHRYVLAVYEQPGRITIPEEEHVSATSGFPPRRSFKSRAFAERFGLTPVAVVTYTAEWDELQPELAKKLQGLA
jgi:hypothetical protein